MKNAALLLSVLAALQAAAAPKPNVLFLFADDMRADTIAAVACVAGGAQGAPPTSIAPLLVVAGELDPIVNASGLEQGSQRLKAAGLPVEYQLVKGFGHTLVVGEKLPAVVDWLLTHTR